MTSARVTLIDNYDSFTWNLVHLLGKLDVRCTVIRNDQATVDEILADEPDALVLSPGPCTPDQAGICLELSRAALNRVALFGVCLGHQALAQAFGAVIAPAPALMHGKISAIRHDGCGVFEGLPPAFRATRYHSLVVDPATLGQDFTVAARSDDGVIMGIMHKTWPLFGVQFHPESIATEHGEDLLRNFLRLARKAVPA